MFSSSFILDRHTWDVFVGLYLCPHLFHKCLFWLGQMTVSSIFAVLAAGNSNIQKTNISAGLESCYLILPKSEVSSLADWGAFFLPWTPAMNQLWHFPPWMCHSPWRKRQATLLSPVHQKKLNMSHCKECTAQTIKLEIKQTLTAKPLESFRTK